MNYSDYKFTVSDHRKVRVIIDTDAKNEADDQFAIVQALLSPRCIIKGLVATHFGLKGSGTMEQSYEEAKKILDLMDIESKDFLYKGVSGKLADKEDLKESEGVDFIIREAMKEDEKQLIVMVLGAITNIACAIKKEPKIINKMRVIWIGGGPYPSGEQEFNCLNDITAVNIVMESGVELWQVPKNVYSMMRVSLAELEYKVADKGELGAYLLQQLDEHAQTDKKDNLPLRSGEYWILGDSPAIGLIIAEHVFDYEMRKAPIVLDDCTYAKETHAHEIRVYQYVDSRFILEDFYAKLALFEHKRKYIK